MLDKIANAIKEAENIAIFTHVNPDGDTIGSAFAVSAALRKMGKSVCVFVSGPVPKDYEFLPGAKADVWEDGSKFDISLAIDVSDEGRLGALKDAFFSAPLTSCIDHHGTNPGFADINCVRSSAAAVAEVIVDFLDALGVEIDSDIAACLFVAVSTDTNNFSFSNTTGDTLRMAARLVDAGADVDLITGRLYRRMPIAKTRLIGKTVSTLKTSMDGKVAIMTSSYIDRDECGAKDEDYDGIVNYATQSDGVMVAALLRTSSQNSSVKVSVRSSCECDAAKIAAVFGGGGHSKAAGCTINQKTLEEAAQLVRAAAEAEVSACLTTDS